LGEKGSYSHPRRKRKGRRSLFLLLRRKGEGDKTGEKEDILFIWRGGKFISLGRLFSFRREEPFLSRAEGEVA